MTVTKLRKTKMHTAKRRKTKRTTTKRRKTKRTTATLRKTKRTTTKRRKTKRTTAKLRKTKRTAKRRKTKHLKRTLKGGQNPKIQATNGSSIELKLNNKTTYTLATADIDTDNSTVCNDSNNNPVSIKFEKQGNDIILKVNNITYGNLDKDGKGIFITSAPYGSCLSNDYYEFASFNVSGFKTYKIVLKKHMFIVTDKLNNPLQLVYKSKYTLKFPQTNQTTQTTQTNPEVTFIDNEGHIDIISDDIDIISDHNNNVGNIIVNEDISKFEITSGFFISKYNINSQQEFQTYNITTLNRQTNTITLE
jgi:hypothetical protein